MFGIFFAMPQYFQEVQGANAMGSGLRLLPLIGGLVVGMIGSTRLATPRRSAGQVRAPLASVKALATAGFTIMAVALAFGASTKIGSGTGFAAAWLAAFGLGLGLAMPQTMNAALSALSAERSGSGSALISALRQVGATIGVAVLGTVLVTVYRSHLGVPGLPAAAAATAKASVVAGVGVAHAAGVGGPARLGPDRVRPGHGHHAVGLRRHRGGQRHPGPVLPAAPARRDRGRRRGPPPSLPRAGR